MFSSTFLSRSSSARTRSPSSIKPVPVVPVVGEVQHPVSTSNVSAPRTRASSSCATPSEPDSRGSRSYEPGMLSSFRLRQATHARHRQPPRGCLESASSTDACTSPKSCDGRPDLSVFVDKLDVEHRAVHTCQHPSTHTLQPWINCGRFILQTGTIQKCVFISRGYTKCCLINT